MIQVIDLRSKQANPPPVPKGAKAKHKVVDGKVVMRDPKTITGITIHQTACMFGPHDNPPQKHLRALKIAAHATAFQDGTVVLANPLESYVWHGNGFNSFTLGLECEGLLRGIFDRSRPQLSLIAVESFRTGVRELVERGRKAGMPIEFILAHRQSHPTKVADPGGEIWQRVVLEYAVAVLGLKTRNDFIVGQGHPIPASWDPNASASY